MKPRPLGSTGLEIAPLALGAGPVSTLMTGDDVRRQRAVVERAIARGIRWIDTAATYGEGRSEQNLGRVLEELGAGETVHVATKVRLVGDDLGDIRTAVRRSVARSLARLRRTSVTLLQLHNGITARRGDEPTSLSVADVLGPHGVAEAFDELRAAGLVRHVGLTGVGQATAVGEAVRSGRFATLQVPYHLLNPSAGRAMPEEFPETNYGNIMADCAAMGMGVFAIRVLAGGALAGRPASLHTLKTPFFPLDLYRRDTERAAELRARLEPGARLEQEAVRFAVSHPHVTAAIIGFGDPEQVDDAVEAIEGESAGGSTLNGTATRRTEVDVVSETEGGNVKCKM
jgi:aryl-alcohol dehydrogenase-like predicted oxidoreductase